MFSHLCRNINDEWTDDWFMDHSCNTLSREWLLATNTRTGEQYAALLRSDGPDGDFEWSVKLPTKFVGILSNAIPNYLEK